MPALLLKIHLLQPFWHGMPEWPPSPFRVFQALVAGAFSGRWVEENPRGKTNALAWLESLEPPLIAAPPRSNMRQVTSYVPNNDLDAVGGDPRRVDEIRAEKTTCPAFLEFGQAFAYAWQFEQGNAHAEELCSIASRLHTFGRGVDPAWAEASIINTGDVEPALFSTGPISMPGISSPDHVLPCPTRGSLASLFRRHEAFQARLQRDRTSRKILYRQPPKAHFRPVSYDRTAAILEFVLRRREEPNRFYPVPQLRAVRLVQQIRDAASARLAQSSPDLTVKSARYLVGKEAGPSDLRKRVRIIPLPSIGHTNTSPSIRRILVEIPPDCPIRRDDLAWAFESVSISLSDESATSEGFLSQETAGLMKAHYGVNKVARTWRSVTPVALPLRFGHARNGSERSRSEQWAAEAIANAVRHAGIDARAISIRVQPEPFHQKGEMANRFEPDRFDGRLRHVEITFDQPVKGPVVIGDGRFLGLGVMRPVREQLQGIYAFALSGPELPHIRRSAIIARHLRRAVMARAQAGLRYGQDLPALFHGHDTGGKPLRSGHHEHLFFAAFASDSSEWIDRIAVIAPQNCDRSISGEESRLLDVAASELRILRCGADGVLSLTPVDQGSVPELFGSGRIWTSTTPYSPTRHPKSPAPFDGFIENDIRTECSRRGMHTPKRVLVNSVSTGPRGGLRANITLEFAISVNGPVLIGQNSHFGDGLFATSATNSESST